MDIGTVRETKIKMGARTARGYVSQSDIVGWAILFLGVISPA
jgi:hypothetical protein